MKHLVKWLMVPLFAITGAMLFINLFAHHEFRIDALDVVLSVKTSVVGKTVLEVPPVGEVMANTHKSPLTLVISLKSIDLEGIKSFINQMPSQAEIVQSVKTTIIQQVKKFMLLVLALGFLGGVFGLVVLQRTKVKQLLLGGLIGLLSVLLLFGFTYKTYDMEKFKSPEYVGMIKAAPFVINLAQNSLTTMNTWSHEMRVIADNLYGLFNRVETLNNISDDEGDIQVLHVSDIHNNPASFEFIKRVTQTFHVDLVVDSGDISDFGTPLEGVLVQKLQNLNVPYVFIPGNHETTSIVNEMQKIPNVKVVLGNTLTIKGVKISGIADPNAYSESVYAPSDSEIKEYTAKLQKIVDGAGSTPDLVVVHNPKIATNFWGRVPVILTGHDHAYKIKEKANSVLIDAGTSGAAGVGALRTEEEIPYTFVLLHFARTDKGLRLKYTDTISISNQQSGYSLDRKVYSGVFDFTKI